MGNMEMESVGDYSLGGGENELLKYLCLGS